MLRKLNLINAIIKALVCVLLVSTQGKLLKAEVPNFEDIDALIKKEAPEATKKPYREFGPFKLQIKGEINNLTAYHDLNKESLLNPDNIFDARQRENKTTGLLNLENSIGSWNEIIIKGRAEYEIYQGEGDASTDDLSQFDQAYTTFKFGNDWLYFLSLGKQRVEWGTGYFWNPMDTVNPQTDLSSIDEPEEGKTLARIDIDSTTLALTGVYIPDVDEDDDDNQLSQEVAKVYLFVLDTDFTLTYSKLEEQETRWGFSFSTVVSDLQIFGETVCWHGASDQNYIRKKTERTKQIDVETYYLPPTYEFYTREGHFHNSVLGFQYTFENNITLVGEVY
ncbi:MAG: hypothetical protein MJE63_01145, partial [Proteobacteria bacterium]|nr:hypothetical protein [Pseudomonadota bacterium]